MMLLMVDPISGINGLVPTIRVVAAPRPVAVLVASELIESKLKC